MKDDLRQISLCEASISFIELCTKRLRSDGSKSDLPYTMEGYGGSVLIFRKVEEPAYWLTAVAFNCNGDSDCDQFYLIYQFLGRIYSSYVRQCGSFSHSVKNETSNSVCQMKLRKKCALFFQWLLPHALPESGSVSLMISPASSFGSRPEGLMKYISPIDSSTFLNVRSFLSHATFSYSMDSRIFMMFLCNENLVTSTLCMLATRILYLYITTNVLPDALCDELASERKRSNLNTYWYADRKPILLYLPQDDASHTSEWSKRDIYIYRSLNGATLAVILDSLDNVDAQATSEAERKMHLHSIELYAKQHMYNLAASIAKAMRGSLESNSRSALFHSSISSNSSTSPDIDTGLYYLYYNEANGALKVYPTSFQPSMSRQSSSSSLASQTLSTSGLSRAEILRSWVALESDLRSFLKDTKRHIHSYDCDEREAATSADAHEEEGERPPAPSTAGCHSTGECREDEAASSGLIEILAKSEPDEHWLLVRRIDERFLYATLTSHKI